MCRGKRKKFRLKNIRRLFCLCFPLGNKGADAYVKEKIEVPLCSSQTRSDDAEVCVDDTVCALGQGESAPEPKGQVHDDYDEDCSPRQWIPKRRLLTTTDLPPEALLFIVIPSVWDSIPVWEQRDIPACIFTWPSTKASTLSCMYRYPTSLIYYAICLWQLYLVWHAHTQSGCNLCRDITLSGIAVLRNFLMVATQFHSIKDIRKTLINNHYIIHAFVVHFPAHPALYKAIFGYVYYRMVTYSYRVPNVGIQNMDITVDRDGDMKLNYFVLPQYSELLSCPCDMKAPSIPPSQGQLVRYKCPIHATRRPVELPRWKFTTYQDIIPSRVDVLPYSSPMHALSIQAANTTQVTARLIGLPRLKLAFHKDIVSSSVEVFPGSIPLQASSIEPSHGELVPYTGPMQANTRHIALPRLKLMFHEDNVSSSVELFPESGPMEALIMQSPSHVELVAYTGPTQITARHITLPRLKRMFHKDNVSFNVELFPASGHMEASIIKSFHGEPVSYTGHMQANTHHISLPRLKLMFHKDNASFSVELFQASGHMESSIIHSSRGDPVPYTGPMQANSRHIAPARLDRVFYKHILSSISQLLSSSCTILPRRRHILSNRRHVQATVLSTPRPQRVQLRQRGQLLAPSIKIHVWPDVIYNERHNGDNGVDDCVSKDIAPDTHGFISTGRDDVNDDADADGDSEYKKGGMTSSSGVPVANTYKSVAHGNFILDKHPPIKHAPLVKKHPKAILQAASDPPPQEQMQNDIAALLTVADIHSPSQETQTDLKIPSHVSNLRSEKDEDVDTKLGDRDRCKTGLYEQPAYSSGAAPLFLLHVRIHPHLSAVRTKLHDTALAICCLAVSTTRNPRRWDEKQLNLLVADSAGIQANILQYTKKVNCDIDQLPQDLKVIFESLPCGPQSLRLGVKNVISGSVDNSPSWYYIPSAPDDLLTSLRLILKLYFNIGAVMWCAETVYAIMRVKLNKVADYKEERVTVLTRTQNEVVMYFFEDLAGCVEFIKCQFEKTETFQLLPVYKYTSYLHHAMRYFKTA